MDHHIGWGESRCCCIAQCHPRWQNELITLPTRIRLFEGKLWAAGETIAGEDDGLECGGSPLPTSVAIHAVVAAADGCDLCRRGRLTHALLERDERCRGRTGWRIAAIEEKVHEDSRDTGSVCRTKHLNRMAVVGVYAAVAKERDEMQPTRLGSAHCTTQAAHLGKRTVSNRGINAGKVLRYALSTSNVEVTNLAVPHLTSRESDRFAARSQRRVRVLGTERTPVRH
jgi:hypothetical protein